MHAYITNQLITLQIFIEFSE